MLSSSFDDASRGGVIGKFRVWKTSAVRGGMEYLPRERRLERGRFALTCLACASGLACFHPFVHPLRRPPLYSPPNTGLKRNKCLCLTIHTHLPTCMPAG